MKFFGTQLLTLFALTVAANADIALRGLKANNGNGQDKERKNPFKGRRPVKEEKVEGGKVKKVKEGRPLSDIPSAKKIKTKELVNLEELPAEGLYLLDTDLIPESLEEDLEQIGVNIGPDGSLTNQEGEPALVILESEMYEVTPDDPVDEDDDGGRRLASP